MDGFVPQAEYDQIVALAERSNKKAAEFKRERDEAYADIGIALKFFADLGNMLEIEKNRDKDGRIKTTAIVMKLGMIALNPEKNLAQLTHYLPHATRLSEKYKSLISSESITPHKEV